DVDGDGRLDAVAASSGSDTVSVLLNTTAPGAGATSFAPARSLPVGEGSEAVAIADFNGDGARDLATADNVADTVSVLFNLGCVPCAVVCPDDVYAGLANAVQGATIGRVVTYPAPTTT